MLARDLHGVLRYSSDYSLLFCLPSRITSRGSYRSITQRMDCSFLPFMLSVETSESVLETSESLEGTAAAVYDDLI